MTLIAGIFNRKGHPLVNGVCRELAESVSRHPKDAIETISQPGAFFAKLDIAAFGSKGVLDSDNALSLLTGEPLLEGSTNRQADLNLLHDDLTKENNDRLREANGAFSLVHFRKDLQTLSLIADKCAIRPLYVWMSDELVVFASALRILELCPLVPKKMDLRGVTEIGNRRERGFGLRVPRGGHGLHLRFGRDAVQTVGRVGDDVGAALAVGGDELAGAGHGIQARIAEVLRADAEQRGWIADQGARRVVARGAGAAVHAGLAA